jgi:hypothetical protein
MEHAPAVEKFHDAGLDLTAWSWGTTAVATIMSQRSLKATDSADLPGRLRAVSE